MKTPRKTTRLRQLIRNGCVAMPGAHNAATARLIAQAGFDAVYVSGAGLANATVGVPDIDLLSLAEVAQLAGYIARAVTIPTLVDADTGFGGPASAAKAVRTFERAGQAGMHLEDQVFPKRCGHLEGKTLVSIKEMTAKIRAAAKARSDADFIIVARTDARAVERLRWSRGAQAHAYLAAGADAIFPEALETARELSRVRQKESARRSWPTMDRRFGRSPSLSVRQLAAAGYRMVLFPLTAFRVSRSATEKCLRDLQRRGSQRSWLGKMQTRVELYELLGYDPKSGDFSRGG